MSCAPYSCSKYLPGRAAEGLRYEDLASRRVCVIQYYDGTKEFLAMDSDGHPVIGLWVDDMPHATRWLLIPVRKKDVLAYVSGTKTLRDLRADPRQGKLYVFDEFTHPVLNCVAPCDLPQDYPPGDTGEYLGYRETTATILGAL